MIGCACSPCPCVCQPGRSCYCLPEATRDHRSPPPPAQPAKAADMCAQSFVWCCCPAAADCQAPGSGEPREHLLLCQALCRSPHERGDRGVQAGPLCGEYLAIAGAAEGPGGSSSSAWMSSGPRGAAATHHTRRGISCQAQLVLVPSPQPCVCARGQPCRESPARPAACDAEADVTRSAPASRLFPPLRITHAPPQHRTCRRAYSMS